MHNYIRSLILIASAATLVVACGSLDKKKDSGNAPAPQPSLFDSTISPMIVRDCGACHGDGGVVTQKLPLVTEKNLQDNADAVAASIQIVGKGQMPPAKYRTMTPDEIKTLLQFLGKTPAS